jgi:hypothetical protein
MCRRHLQRHFPYELRAAETQAAHRAVHTTFAQMRRREDPNDPATAAWLAAITRFRAAVAAAYPPGFWDDVAPKATRAAWKERLNSGDEAIRRRSRWMLQVLGSSGRRVSTGCPQ